MFGFTEVVLRHYLARSGLELVLEDEWTFHATAIKVSGEPRLDLSDLPFMSLALPGDPTPPQGRSSVPPEARQTVLAPAQAVTDPGAVDLSATRFRPAKRLLLRLLRLVTSRQARHNRGRPRGDRRTRRRSLTAPLTPFSPDRAQGPSSRPD